MNPDYEIEQFWLGLKQSMLNFYEKKSYCRPIDLWSDELNDLQSIKMYDLIEENIRNYISLYAIDLMKSMNIYYSHILKTNIKRWNNISKKFKFDEPNTTQNIIFTLFDIFCYFVEKDTVNSMIQNIFLQIELTILYQDFTILIKYAVLNNKPSILTKLENITNVREKINKLFDIKIDDKLSYRKYIEKF